MTDFRLALPDRGTRLFEFDRRWWRVGYLRNGTFGFRVRTLTTVDGVWRPVPLTGCRLFFRVGRPG